MVKSLDITDYYAGGSLQAKRHYATSESTRGFGGQENDPEIYGEGNATTAEYWEYDSRLQRRWNVDPVVKPWESPYATFSNNPIVFNDPKGLSAGDPTKKAARQEKRAARKDARKGGTGTTNNEGVGGDHTYSDVDTDGSFERSSEDSYTRSEQGQDHKSRGRFAAKVGSILNRANQRANDYVQHADSKTEQPLYASNGGLEPAKTKGGLDPGSAYWHYKFGGGTYYPVDISQIDFSMLSEKNFPGGAGSTKQINIFNIAPTSTAGLVFGDILLTYLGNNQIQVSEYFISGPNKGQPYFDTYNFNVRWGEIVKGRNLKRNVATALGWVGVNMPWNPLLVNTYGGDSYKFIFYGTATIGRN